MKHKKSERFFSAQKSKGFLTCPKCNGKMEKIKVKVEGAIKRIISYQCDCGYFEFDQKTGKDVIEEIESKSKSPLNIRQKFIKISHGRLGNYWDENIIRATDIKAGESFFVSVPDPKHILISLK